MFKTPGSRLGQVRRGAVQQGTSIVAATGVLCNSNLITQSFTLPPNTNAISAGPVTVANGVAITVPSGAVWTVV